MAKEKDIRYQANCSICSNKIGFFGNGYVHVLSDGTLCKNCNLTLHQLVDERKWWVDTDEFNALGLQENYDFFEGNCMPLKEAQALLALRDRVSARFLKSVGLESGNVFAVQRVFAVSPSPPCFILRARKIRNRAVLQGFTLKGSVKKGDTVRLNIGGEIRSFTAVDVVPSEFDPLTTDTFYNKLIPNVHNHTLSEKDNGWIIIDIEEYKSIAKGIFAATCR